MIVCCRHSSFQLLVTPLGGINLIDQTVPDIIQHLDSPIGAHTLGADPYLPGRHIESFLRVFEQFACNIPRGVIFECI